jgi:hypothetical protein
MSMYAQCIGFVRLLSRGTAKERKKSCSKCLATGFYPSGVCHNRIWDGDQHAECEVRDPLVIGKIIRRLLSGNAITSSYSEMYVLHVKSVTKSTRKLEGREEMVNIVSAFYIIIQQMSGS